MTKEELKAQHPEVYSAIAAEGRAEERKRVNAHLKMGDGYAAMDIAQKAIASGAELDSELIADYLTAAKSAASRAARQEDSDAAGAIVDGAPKKAAETPKDNGDLVAAAMGLPLPKKSAA